MKTSVYTPEVLLRNLLHGATICLMATSVIITSACGSSDDPAVEPEPMPPILSAPINLTPLLTPATNQSGAATRLAIGATAFDNDDVLGIYLAHTEGATAEQPITAAITPLNAKWQNGTYTGDKTLYWQNTADTHTLYAYFPYTASVDAGFKAPATILADQNAATAAADYEAADLLWGKFSTTALQTVSVPMQHCMSEVTVTITQGSGFGIDESLPDIDKVELLCAEGFRLNGSWNLADGSVTAGAATAATTSLATYIHTTAAQGEDGASIIVYRAIVMPGQVFGKSAEFIRATTTDGTTYTYKLAVKNAAGEPADLTAAANHTYTFALKLNKSTLDLTQSTFSVSSWTSGEPVEGGADMDI